MGNESRKKNILVIDDDERVLTGLECFLENEGYETTTAWTQARRTGLDTLVTQESRLSGRRSN